MFSLVEQAPAEVFCSVCDVLPATTAEAGLLANDAAPHLHTIDKAWSGHRPDYDQAGVYVSFEAGLFPNDAAPHLHSTNRTWIQHTVNIDATRQTGVCNGAARQ
jgi:hypothetical protein